MSGKKEKEEKKGTRLVVHHFHHICHPEGAQRPKDLVSRTNEILRFAQDDKMKCTQLIHGLYLNIFPAHESREKNRDGERAHPSDQEYARTGVSRRSRGRGDLQLQAPFLRASLFHDQG